MTLLISWIGVDLKKSGPSIASLYIASDSRFSHSINNTSYDYGNKVFGAINYPEIFGFCGDVLFPSIVLGQIIPQIDKGLLINPSDSNHEKNDKIFKYIISSFHSYPTTFLSENFTILHGTRTGSLFQLFKISYRKNSGFDFNEINLPDFSTKVFCGGSGAAEFDQNWIQWQQHKHNDNRTSRGVYHCLDYTLKTIKDPRTGGLPQIIGLYRVENSRLFGMVIDDKRYIYGKNVSENIRFENIEWRNSNFERIDGNTLKLIDGAQRQPQS